jgi:HK97 gp10 family phage protein
VITFKVEGLQELERRLLEFGPKVARNGLRAANFAGAKVFREAAKQSAPVRTGLLKASISAFKRQSPQNVAKHSVGVKGVRKKYANTAANRRARRVGRKYQADGPAFYGRFLEFGTSKMSARPFLRPAFQNNIGNAIDAVKVRLAKAIELAARK